MSKFRHSSARTVLALTVGLASLSAQAAFSESGVPSAVRTLYCDNNPRVIVEFADASKNVWYPANAGDQTKAFVAAALAAKVASQKFWYYGLGDPLATTAYCVGISARQVQMFGLE